MNAYASHVHWWAACYISNDRGMQPLYETKVHKEHPIKAKQMVGSWQNVQITSGQASLKHQTVQRKGKEYY